MTLVLYILYIVVNVEPLKVPLKIGYKTRKVWFINPESEKYRSEIPMVA